MKKKSNTNSSNHKIILAILFIAIGIAIGISLTPKEVKEAYDILSLQGETRVSMNILAINNRGDGVFSRLTTQVRPGNGLVLLNINDVLADYYSQYSSRVAAKIASDYTNISLKNIDVVYNIQANATAIEGSSAGSAMAVSTIAALQNRQLNHKVVITGSINEDGTLGDVGAVRQKGIAAREAGAEIMLVPKGSLRHEADVKEEKSCGEYNNIQYCEIKYVSQPTDIGKGIGIKIIEVANINEAMGYFYQASN